MPLEVSGSSTPFDRVDDAIEDIRRGKVVIVADDEDRENEGDLVCAAEAVTPEIINFMARHARGLILTEQGDLLFRTAHDVFMQLQAARAKLTDSRERPSGDLKITTPPALSPGRT